MRIVLDLSDKDIRYFRSCLQTVKQGKHASDESIVLKAANDMIAEVASADAPEFVKDRIGKLELLVRMLEDQRWRLVGNDRARVLNVLAYFVDPDDLIPDRIPGIGYLDDAIMVELVVQELRHEIDAYEKFCAFKPQERDPEDVERKRVALQSRMRRNRRSERERRRTRRRHGAKAPLGLW